MTKLRVTRRAAARSDLVDHFTYLTEAAGLKMADRFLDSAAASFDLLARQPTIGAPLVLSRPELSGLRKWRVQDFDNFLIFYQPLADRVSIVRVLHATRDWWHLLGIATGDPS